MRSTFKLLYFVKRNAVKKNGNAPIIARITIDQVVAQFNTKLEINPTHWSVELGRFMVTLCVTGKLMIKSI